MQKLSPLTSALAAAAYIVLTVLLISTLSERVPDDTIVTPMVALSLFVLSAAIMGFLFLGRPIQLYLDGQKREAITFFGITVGFFACFVALLIVTLLIVR